MELNAKLPQLPENFKASLAKWLWVLVIIAIVINIMGIMTILGIGALGGVLLFSAGFGAMSIQLWIMIITGVVGMGITVVAEIIAIKPLKEKNTAVGISLSAWRVYNSCFPSYMILPRVPSAAYSVPL